MSEPLRLGVESDDPADLEIGCTVFSRTHQDSRGYVGGCVVAIDREAETVTVMSNISPTRGPDTRTLNISELEPTATTFDTRNAGIVASHLLTWTGQMNSRERGKATKWLDLARDLLAISDRPGYTPRAEARYKARHQPQTAPPAPSEPPTDSGAPRPYRAGDVVRIAIPAPGKEAVRYAVVLSCMALWSDGTPSGSEKVVICTADGEAFVIGATDLVLIPD